MLTTLLSFLMSLSTLGAADASAESLPADLPGVVSARAQVEAVITTCPIGDRPWLITEEANDEDDFGDGDGIMPVALISSVVVFGAESSGSIRKGFARQIPAQRSPILRC